MNKYEQFKQYPTEPGWYCIGFDRDDSNEQAAFGPDFGPIWYFDGSDWTDESGEAREYLIDPCLNVRIAMDAADYYAKQG